MTARSSLPRTLELAVTYTFNFWSLFCMKMEWTSLSAFTTNVGLSPGPRRGSRRRPRPQSTRL